jgi:nucleotide-binding universal stress UspA family protein
MKAKKTIRRPKSVSKEHKPTGKPLVIVALRDMEHVDALTRMGCFMAGGMGADLMGINVVEVAQGLPIDADAKILDEPGKAVLARARDLAAKSYSKQMFTLLIRARETGKTIVDEARERHADLIIVGYKRHDLWAGNVLGSTAQYVANHARCRVVIAVIPHEERAPQLTHTHASARKAIEVM